MNPAARRTAAESSDSRDAGIGLIEVVVAMMLFALLALAFLPLVASGVTSSRTNAIRATATQVVERQLTEARALADASATGTTCAALSRIAKSDVAAGNGTTLRPAATVTCPTAFPGTARFVVTVATTTGTQMATATTLVLVSAA